MESEDDLLPPETINNRDSKTTFLNQLKSEKKAFLFQKEKIKEKKRDKDQKLKIRAMERKELVTNLLQELKEVDFSIDSNKFSLDQNDTDSPLMINNENSNSIHYQNNSIQVPRTLAPTKNLEIKSINPLPKGLLNIKSVDLQVRRLKCPNFNQETLLKNEKTKRIHSLHASLIHKAKRRNYRQMRSCTTSFAHAN